MEHDTSTTLMPMGSIEDAKRKIVQLDASAKAIALDAAGNLRHALEAAYDCGLWLNFAKTKVNPTEWLQWLHDTGVDKHRADAYIRMSKRNTRTNLLSSQNARQQMELVGFCQTATTRVNTPVDKTKTVHLPESLDAIGITFKRWKVSQFDPRIATADDTLLLRWEEVLKPMRDVYSEVEARLREKRAATR